jgi:SAM-dependent methyltransferase
LARLASNGQHWRAAARVEGTVSKCHERADCRLCGGAIERVLDLGETPLANALEFQHNFVSDEGRAFITGPLFPLYLARCITCGHVQLPVVADPSLMFNQNYAYQSGTSPVFREHLRKQAVALARDVPDRGLVVEVGSNDGVLLECFRNVEGKKLRTIGVDPSSKPVHCGVLTAAAPFDIMAAEAVYQACGEADLIVANNVFAHIDDMNAVIDGVKLLLAPTGRLVFEVAYLPHMLRAGTFDLVYHEHLSYHHVTAVESWLRGRGLYVYDAEPVDTQGGSIRYHAGLQRRAHADRLLDFVRDEPLTCGPAAIAALASSVERFRRDFPARLAAMKAAGKRIAAFGCPAKATTLLHACGIGRETIDYMVEEAPTKQGKFSPGKHIPIVAPGHFDTNPADVMVCLAWNFAEDIKRRYAHWPVEWVVPFLDAAEREAA